MLNVKPSTSLLTILVLLALLPMLPACAVLEKLPPPVQYTPDRQDNCIEDHTWGQTVGNSSGPSIAQCAAIGWH